jgi:hypothetical protein
MLENVQLKGTVSRDILPLFVQQSAKKIELGFFSAAKTFSQKKSEYLHEFEAKIENILGL